MVRVPGLGPGGRRFESFHPDHFFLIFSKIIIVIYKFTFKSFYMVGLAQLVRALVCGAGGRGFESRISPHSIILNINFFTKNDTSVRGSTG